jgi:predicted SnoaL-like aldol condensation-catalyzing enzyme
MGRRLDNATALYLRAIRDGQFVEAIHELAGERYTQHSTPVRDGPEGFIEFFADFVRRNPRRDIEVVRGFEDGRYVFLHVVQDLNDGEFRYVTADIFDTDDQGRLVEHWDVIAELGADRTRVDGPTEPTDLGRTEENKALVRDFLHVVLRDGELDRLDEFVSPNGFRRHDPAYHDGMDALRAYLREHGVVYDEVHLVIGCGDQVATLAKVRIDGADHAVIDLFRVAGGRIVEQWDVVEPIPPPEDWVNTGKF